MQRAERESGATSELGALALVGGLVLVVALFAAAILRRTDGAPAAADPDVAAAARLVETTNLLHGLRARVDLVQRALLADVRATIAGKPGVALDPAVDDARRALGDAREASASTPDAWDALGAAGEALEEFVEAARHGALAAQTTKDAARASADVVVADELRRKVVGVVAELSDATLCRALQVEAGQ